MRACSYERACARARVLVRVCLCDAATRFTGDAAHYRDTMQCRYQQRATLCVHEFACLAGSEEAQWTARTEICMYQKAGNQCEMTFGCPTIWGVAAGCEIGLNCTDKRPRPELSLSLSQAFELGPSCWAIKLSRRAGALEVDHRAGTVKLVPSSSLSSYTFKPGQRPSWNYRWNPRAGPWSWTVQPPNGSVTPACLPKAPNLGLTTANAGVAPGRRPPYTEKGSTLRDRTPRKVKSRPFSTRVDEAN